MPIKLKRLLLESMQWLYHATDIDYLTKILKDDALKMTFIGGSQADSELNRGKLFYLSTSRDKYGRYARSGENSKKYVNKRAVLVLDGRRIENSKDYKLISVDYWKSKIDTHESEAEERIVSDINKLTPLGKYVTEIHVYLKLEPKTWDETEKYKDNMAANRDHWNRKNIVHIYFPLLEAVKNSNIPCYFYGEELDIRANKDSFKLQRKERSIPIERVKELLDNVLKDINLPEEAPYTYSSTIRARDFAEIRAFSDILRNPENYLLPTDKLHDTMRQWFLTYVRDAEPHLSALIHNNKYYHPDEFLELAKVMQSKKLKTLKQAVDYLIKYYGAAWRNQKMR